MSSRRKIDAIDLGILNALQLHGRRSFKVLADLVHLSPTACITRHKRLEDEKVIRRYVTDINLEALGRSLTLYAEVTLAGHHPEDFAAFDRAIGQFAEVTEAAQISGSADYILKVVVPDIERWGAINDALLERGIRIASIRTSVVMKQAKRFIGLPLDLIANGDQPEA